MATQTTTPTKLQQLQQASQQAYWDYRRGWAPGKKNTEYDTWQAAQALVTAEVLALVARAKEAGLNVGAGYAYSPNEGGSSGGKYHVTVLDAIANVGRAERKRWDAFCKPARKFSHLDSRPLTPENLPNCHKCLVMLEKLVNTLAPTTNVQPTR
jgi:hypothetical protein